MQKGGIIVKKKEMTKMWIDDAFTPVTLVQVAPQEIVRYKTIDTDGYLAMVVGVGKKELDKDKGQKISYALLTEFSVDEGFMQSHEAGSSIDAAVVDGIETVHVVGTAKGKGFQGVMKRFHAKGGPKTHGSKFHRQVGSLGNRKPRRVQKGHPHAGRMGGQQITLHNKKIVDIVTQGDDTLIAIKGSIPGAYNSTLKLLIG